MEQCTTALGVAFPNGSGAPIRGKLIQAQAVADRAACMSCCATASALQSSNSSCTACWTSSGLCSSALCDTLTGTTEPWQDYSATRTSTPLAAPDKPSLPATAPSKQLCTGTHTSPLASSKPQCSPSLAVGVRRMFSTLAAGPGRAAVQTSARALMPPSASSYTTNVLAPDAAAAEHLVLAVRSPSASPTPSISGYRHAAVRTNPARRRRVLGYVGVDVDEYATAQQWQKQEQQPHELLAARLVDCSARSGDGQRRNGECGVVHGRYTVTRTLLEQDNADVYGTDVQSMADVAAAHGYLLSPGTVYGSRTSAACALYDTFSAAAAAEKCAAVTNECTPGDSAGTWQDSLPVEESAFSSPSSSSSVCLLRNNRCATSCAASATGHGPHTASAAVWAPHDGEEGADAQYDDEDDSCSFFNTALFSGEALAAFSSLARSAAASPAAALPASAAATAAAAAAAAEGDSHCDATLMMCASLLSSPSPMSYTLGAAEAEAEVEAEEVAKEDLEVGPFLGSCLYPGAPGGLWVPSSGMALLGAMRSADVEECGEVWGSSGAAAGRGWGAGGAAPAAAAAACAGPAAAVTAAAAADGGAVTGGGAGCVQGVVAAPAASAAPAAVRRARRVGSVIRAALAGCFLRP